MRVQVAAIVVCVAGTQAFKNTSPFALVSSSASDSIKEAPKSALQFASAVLSTAQTFLKTCPSDLFYIITQPALSPSDFHQDSMPHLFRALGSSAIQSSHIVPDVLGLQSTMSDDIIDTIREGCGVENVAKFPWAQAQGNAMDAVKSSKRVVIVAVEPVVSEMRSQREEMVRNNDAQIETILGRIPKSAKYTVVYISTPLNGTVKADEPLYEAQFESQAHFDLKRNVHVRVPEKTEETDFRPLFEKYQFFTPGIFMGLIVSIIMFMILSVGLSAVSSLQVSYGAFDKEMGPAAQKKA